MYYIDSYLSWPYSSESEPQSRNMSTCPCLTKVQNSKSSPSTLHWLLFAQRALIWILAWVCNSLRSWSMLCLLWATMWQLIMSDANRFFFGILTVLPKLRQLRRIFLVSFQRMLHSLSLALRICQHRQFQQTGSFRKDHSAAVEVRWCAVLVWVKMLISSWTHKKLLMMFSTKIVPSGNLLHSYWKWPIEIVDFPIKNGGSSHSFLYVYQRVYPLVIISVKNFSQPSQPGPSQAAFPLASLDLSCGPWGKTPRRQNYRTVLCHETRFEWQGHVLFKICQSAKSIQIIPNP